jgi:hypothetical protein
VLALAAWPQDGRPDAPPARWITFAWALLWGGGAILQALPGNDSAAAAEHAIGSGSSSAPHWLAHLDTSAAWFSPHGLAVYGLTAVEALIGLAALAPKTARFSAAAGLALAAAIWLVPENFGQIPGGQVTEPNSAPLVALLGIALIAASAGASRFGLQRLFNR